MTSINIIREWREESEDCHGPIIKGTENHGSLGAASGSEWLQQKIRN